MDDPFAPVAQLLSNVILPNLKAVQANQSEQIAANDRVEQAIDELQLYMKSQFALLNAQLTSCRAEIAALQAALEAAQAQKNQSGRSQAALIH